MLKNKSNIVSDIKDKTYGILHVSSRRSKYINNYISLYPYKKNKTVQKLLKTFIKHFNI